MRLSRVATTLVLLVILVAFVGVRASRAQLTVGAGVTVDVRTDGDLDGPSITINGGTLDFLGSLVTSSRSITIESGGATMDVAFASTVTLSGTLGGAGGLTIGGEGTLVLPGSNSYLGGTTINGAVAINADAALGAANTPVVLGFDAFESEVGALQLNGSFSSSRAITILAPTGGIFFTAGGLAVTPGNTATLGGVISGAAPFVAGGGTLVLTGSNTFTGSMIIEGGSTLAISRDANLGAPSATVTISSPFDNGNSTGTLQFLNDMITSRQIFLGDRQGATIDTNGYNVTLLTPIGGSGDLIKTGAGTLTLTGSNAGGADVAAGTLAMGTADSPAEIFGLTNVEVGAVFQGNGSLSDAVSQFNVVSHGLVNRGTVAVLGPGGVLSVSGGYNQASSGTLSVAVSPTSSGLLAINNDAILAGTLNLQPGAGAYRMGTTYLVLTANSITGAFSQVTSSSPGFEVALAETPTTVAITLLQNVVMGGQPIVGVSGNQIAVANILNRAFLNANGELVDDVSALTALPPAQQQQALTQIGGVAHTSDASLSVAGAQQAGAMLLGRVLPDGAGGGAQITGPAQFAFGQNGAAVNRMVASASRLGLGASQAGGGETGLWLQGAANWGSVSGNANAPGSGSQGGGVMGGYDRAVGGGFRVGAALGYGTAQSVQDANGGSGTIDSWRGALYGGWADGPVALGASVAYAHDHFTANRSIAPLGLVANSSHEGNEVSLSLEAGYRIDYGGVAVVPFAAGDYIHLAQAGFSEIGAGALDLAVAPSSFDSFQPELGVRVSREVTLDSGTRLRPELRLGLRREVLNITANTSSQLTAAASAGSFTAQGVALDRTIGDFGVRLVARRPDALEFSFAFDARVSGNQNNETLGLGLRYSF
jgi:outer membrane autotransporter protein